MWHNLYLAPDLVFNPYETGRTELIRFFIDQMNTGDLDMRQHLSIILWRYTKQIIVIDKNSSEVMIITNIEEKDARDKIAASFSTLSQSQFQLIIDRWNKWFKDQQR